MGLFLCQPQSSEIVLGFVADSSEATGLKWATAAGGGKVLQVVQGTTSTAATIATTSQTDTNITATITPSLATSKILIITSSFVKIYRGSTGGSGNEQASRYTLLRDATLISGSSTVNAMRSTEPGSSSNDEIDITMVFNTNFLDAPNSTSAITYKVQAAAQSTNGGGNVVWQSGGSFGQILLLEIGA